MKNIGKILCVILTLSLSLCALPLGTGAQNATLLWEQTGTVTPGEAVTLQLSLPDTELAGGFFTLSFDPLLFTLDQITLAPGLEALTLTYAAKDGKLNVLLDAAQNVPVSGALLTLTLKTAEEIAPGTYGMSCTVPDAASFFALDADGTALPLEIGGAMATVTVTDPPLPPAPVRYLACQETAVQNEAFSLRLCGATDAPDSLEHYGFICLITDAQGEKELTVHGSELTDSITGGGRTYTADALGCAALYTATLTLQGEGEVQVRVTPFAKVGDQTLYGGTYTVVYQDGCYQKTEY